MKKRHLLACALAVLLLSFALTGCGDMLQSVFGGGAGSSSREEEREEETSAREEDGEDDDSRDDGADSADSTPASVARPGFLQGGAASSNPAADASSASMPENPDNLRIFVQTTDQTSSDMYPSLVLSPEGTFKLTVNLFEGMGHVWGYYSSTGDDSILACGVQKRDFAGFTGDNVESFAFRILDDGSMQYSGGNIGMTGEGVIFTRDGSYPAGNAIIPDVLATVTADGIGGLNLRMLPSVDSESYGLIPIGSTLKVLNMTKNYDDGETWYLVQFDGYEGWVAAQYTIWVSGREDSQR